MYVDNWYRSFDSADCYYIVDGRKTFNKNQAIAWADGNVDRIRMYWMDEVWEEADLTKPPARSWNELMRERCIQLRNKYDILGVAFSGGYDSKTIVDYFVLNNIPIDELHINHKTYVYYPEAQVAYEQAELIKKNYFPNLKIVNVMLDENYQLNVRNVESESWMMDSHVIDLGFTRNHRAHLATWSQDYARNLTNQRRGIVDGMEKPRLFVHDGHWAMTMMDSLMRFSINSPYEHFYMSRDLPELFLKQVWMMIDWLESMPFATPTEVGDFMNKAQRSEDNYVNEQWNLAVGRNKVDHIINWDLNLNSKPLLKGGMFNIETQSLIQRLGIDLRDPRVQFWLSTAKNFISTYRDAFNIKDNDLENYEYKQVWSYKHVIKPIEPGRLVNKNTLIQI